MTHNLFKETMKILQRGTTIQELAESQKKELNHHIFRGLSFTYLEITKMFDSLTQRYQRPTRKSPSLSWLEEEKKLYQCFLLAYCHTFFKKIIEISSAEWAQISTIFGGKNVLLLRYEAKILERSQERVRWSSYEEDLLNQCTRGLRDLKWAQISRYIFFHSQGSSFKTPKQCRQHWNNHMNQEISHGGWTIEQDLIILEMVLEEGRKWAKIALQLRSKRTQHMIKNRFHSLLTCAKHLYQNTKDDKTNENFLIKNLKKFLESKQKKGKPTLGKNLEKSEQEGNLDKILYEDEKSKKASSASNRVQKSYIKIEKRQSSLEEEMQVGNQGSGRELKGVKMEEENIRYQHQIANNPSQGQGRSRHQSIPNNQRRQIGPSQDFNCVFNGFQPSFRDYSMMRPPPFMSFPFMHPAQLPFLPPHL